MVGNSSPTIILEKGGQDLRQGGRERESDRGEENEKRRERLYSRIPHDKDDKKRKDLSQTTKVHVNNKLKNPSESLS